jgi:hypothetical protein
MGRPLEPRHLNRAPIGARSKAGLSAVTLTTFTDVAWNAPLYRHLGFRVLGEDELGPQLHGVRDKETSHRLDPARRVCMRWELAG